MVTVKGPAACTPIYSEQGVVVSGSVRGLADDTKLWLVEFHNDGYPFANSRVDPIAVDDSGNWSISDQPIGLPNEPDGTPYYLDVVVAPPACQEFLDKPTKHDNYLGYGPLQESCRVVHRITVVRWEHRTAAPS